MRTKLVTVMLGLMIIAIFAFAPLAGLVLRFHWLGLPGVWAALGCWLAARTVLLERRWAEARTAPASRVGGEPQFDGHAQAGQGHDSPQQGDREVARQALPGVPADQEAGG